VIRRRKCFVVAGRDHSGPASRHGAGLFDLLDSHVHPTIAGHFLEELRFPAEALTPLPRTTLTSSEDNVEGMAAFNLGSGIRWKLREGKNN